MLTTPVSSQVLARAAAARGVEVVEGTMGEGLPAHSGGESPPDATPPSEER
jgi:multisubunit Na+/H+ antiporter MnhG subunit